jgi:hypothetical protein
MAQNGPAFLATARVRNARKSGFLRPTRQAARDHADARWRESVPELLKPLEMVMCSPE